MTAVGVGVTLLGYSLFYYGLTQIQSGNWGYLDLIVPSRWPDAASTARDGTSGN